MYQFNHVFTAQIPPCLLMNFCPCVQNTILRGNCTLKWERIINLAPTGLSDQSK